MTEQPNYYVIIPADVRFNHNLSPNAKLLYGEIKAIISCKGSCNVSDKYLSDLYSVSKTTIQNALYSLEKQGYIQRKIKYQAGTKQIEYREIKVLKYSSVDE